MNRRDSSWCQGIAISESLVSWVWRKKIGDSEIAAPRVLPALLALIGIGHAQVIEIDEVISREVGIHIGGISTPGIKEVVSRESSFFIENGRVDGEVISREMSVVIDNSGAPPQVTGYTVTPAADGSSVVLNWSNYNQWAVGDVDSFRIYLSNQPFSDVTGIEPFMTVRGESVSATLNGLATFQNHYIAIVAVDGLVDFNPVVQYSAAYILTKEVLSREVSVAFNAEPEPPYRGVVSREISVVRDNPGAPAPLTDFVVTTSPNGDTATLNWSNYNQWEQYDVAAYRIYKSDTVITSLTNMDYEEVAGENFTYTFSGLTPWVDHYFAIVPVDALMNSDPVFNYGAAYVITPEVISREVGVFMGAEPTPPYRELVSREVSVVRPDATTPAPVTFAGSSFSATTARTTYKGISLDWSGYSEWAQFDVRRYRIYTSTSFVTDVSGMDLHPFAPDDGTQAATITVPNAETIYYVAVVAEDVQGNFNPIVYPVSVKTAVAQLGPVANLTATPTPTTITFSWDLGGMGDELADFVKGFRVYFNGSDESILLGPAARSWTRSSLTPGTSYYVKVKTVDLLDNPSSEATASTTTLQLPGPLAYWRFEEGQIGGRVPNTFQGTLNVRPVLDYTTQGNHLSTYNAGAAPTYRSSTDSSLVPGSLAVNQRCLDFTPNQDLYTSAGTLQNTKLDRFTIEASFNPNGLNRWQVITGKDGNVSGNAPSIRLMQRGDNNRLHIFIVDATGTLHGVDSLQPATPEQWHHLIGTYDGSSLKLYLRRSGQSVPVLQGTTVTNGGLADHAAGWTVGRGWWGTYADWCDGRIDEVRITGDVLPESQFLYARSPLADWLTQNFTLAELGSSQTSGLLADPDFDGQATLVEYALGTLPHVSNGSLLTGSRFTYSEGDRLRILVPRDPAKNDITVEVLAAPDLIGPWSVVATSTLGAPFTGPGYVTGDSLTEGLKTVEVRDIVNIQDASRRFMRVKVTRLTSPPP